VRVQTLKSETASQSLSLRPGSSVDKKGPSQQPQSSPSLNGVEDDEEIAGILTEVGFEYVHSNADLFGGSETESLIREV